MLELTDGSGSLPGPGPFHSGFHFRPGAPGTEGLRPGTPGTEGLRPGASDQRVPRRPGSEGLRPGTPDQRVSASTPRNRATSSGVEFIT